MTCACGRLAVFLSHIFKPATYELALSTAPPVASCPAQVQLRHVGSNNPGTHHTTSYFRTTTIPGKWGCCTSRAPQASHKSALSRSPQQEASAFQRPVPACFAARGQGHKLQSIVNSRPESRGSKPPPLAKLGTASSALSARLRLGATTESSICRMNASISPLSPRRSSAVSPVVSEAERRGIASLTHARQLRLVRRNMRLWPTCCDDVHKPVMHSGLEITSGRCVPSVMCTFAASLPYQQGEETWEVEGPALTL